MAGGEEFELLAVLAAVEALAALESHGCLANLMEQKAQQVELVAEGQAKLQRVSASGCACLCSPLKVGLPC